MPGEPRQGARSLPVRGLRAGRHFEQQDWVADEVPVALEFNGISHAVMLATPLDLEDFALGFSLSEGLLQSADQLYSVEEESSELGITLHCEIASEAFTRLKERRRTMAGRTGCGLCGTESLAQVTRELPQLKAGGTLNHPAIARAMAQFFEHQTLQQATGAVHAAAWCSSDGEVKLLREDVGRHNALDKLIGALARQRIDASPGFIAVTSRASFEMVQKAVSAGVPLLAAVSAPTSFAVATAERAGMTLVGFAREQDLVVYCHPERLALPDDKEKRPMQIDKLVTMANQIGSFFAAMPDHQEALDGIATHIKKFWDPRMRQALLAHIDAQTDSGLTPLVLEAIGSHRELLG